MRPRSDFGLEVFAGAYLLLRCLVSYITYYLGELGFRSIFVTLANLLRARIGWPAYPLPSEELHPCTVVRIVDPCSPHFGALAYIRYSADSITATALATRPQVCLGYAEGAHARAVALWDQDTGYSAAVAHTGSYMLDVMPSGAQSWVKREHLRVKCTA